MVYKMLDLQHKMPTIKFYSQRLTKLKSSPTILNVMISSLFLGKDKVHITNVCSEECAWEN
jgi:hypothetical protein